MATDIHHGGGVGTYKTYSVIQRQAIKQLQAGRVVVSTIRGFDSIRVIEAIMDIEIPSSAEIIFVDLETTKGIERIRKFWEWIPIGAYIIIDEAQLIFPKSRKISTYDYPKKNGLSSEESAEIDNRPNGFLHAFTMHRHFQWDITIITPNIKMLLPEIKEVTQVAYEHKYMGSLLPWAKHSWREIQHNPLETAKASKHPPVRYTADKRIYKVYKSTKSGEHTSSSSERSIFKNPKIIQALVFSVVAVGLFLYMVFSVIISEETIASSKKIPVPDGKIPDFSIRSNGDIRDSVSISSKDTVSRLDSKTPIAIETTRFHSDTMAIVGKFFDEFIIEIGLPPNATQFNTGYLFKNGVKLKIVSDCLIEMQFNDITYNVRCPLHPRKFQEEREQRKPLILNPIATFTGA